MIDEIETAIVIMTDTEIEIVTVNEIEIGIVLIVTESVVMLNGKGQRESVKDAIASEKNENEREN